MMMLHHIVIRGLSRIPFIRGLVTGLTESIVERNPTLRKIADVFGTAPRHQHGGAMGTKAEELSRVATRALILAADSTIEARDQTATAQLKEDPSAGHALRRKKLKKSYSALDAKASSTAD